MKPSPLIDLSELVIVSFTIGILLILFIPIPANILDILLIINFSWALMVLLLTFYTDKPLSFSTFPALLLLSTLFRLALNVSATRLILSSGEAGNVIHAMGKTVIAGNYVMGIVVFFILIIVQFIVVTNGAQRVAEVAARFTLDSMPGKQMSIDADLNMGSISQEDAKMRRAQLEKEASFYGAMDGASKFVKGDAIAGILILLVDILGGFAIGLIQKGLSLSESIEVYTLLTIGDGLVTQIPALIISTATGIIVTRAATDAELGSEVMRQIAASPKSLLMVSIGLLGLLCIEGLPKLPILLILSITGVATKLAYRKKPTHAVNPINTNLYDTIHIYPIEIALNPKLFEALKNEEAELLERFQKIRERIAFELGFVIPEVHVREDNKLNFPFYQINLQGNSQGVSQLHLDKVLVLASNQNPNVLDELPKGITLFDPSYGLPAKWLHSSELVLQEPSPFTICTPLTVLNTHLQEVIHEHIDTLLTREETEKLLSQPKIKVLAEELVPALLNVSQVQRILQNLLQEKVSIRPLSTILEVLLEQARTITEPNLLTELVRNQLATPICQKLLANQSSLHVLTLETNLEHTLTQHLNKETLALDPITMESLIKALLHQVENMLKERKRPILLCSALLRRPIKRLTQRVIPHLAVLAMNEVPINIPIESFGVVKQES